MNASLDGLLEELSEVHEDIRPISARDVVVANWVRFKCRYGCRAYGKHLCCPPYAPTPEETASVLADYERAILARFEAPPNPDVPPKRLHHHLWDSVTRMHKAVFELERVAFLRGFYKAFGFYAMPCTLCQSCVIEERLDEGEELGPLEAIKCRHKDVMRPSMEACGIDVFQTLRNAGYDAEVLTTYSQHVELFGLLLID
ncbi:MAG: DUF2284 domain-containing protein [Methanotrichaceae archaeon]|nr:DUF2284 domain-containing protein [Methanotrichaceae archaeon]